MSQFIAYAAQRFLHFVTSKHRVRIVAVLVGVFVLFAIPFVAHGADLANNAIYRLLSVVLFWIINMLGKLTVVLFGLLVQVAQYNDFLHADAVTIGWRILRDLANMLFILVLLVIAFGTAFRIQQYRYTALLRQLIIMAILINFSMLITGFFIDIMQVIMMTFVNAFADTAAGNLTTALGLDQILRLDTSVPGDQVTDLSIAGTLAIGAVMVAAMLVVTLVYIVIFLGRIIYLWILIILSPLAYLLATFPSTRRYWTQWWQKFWQYASIGPILAFFLWLTLTVTAAGNASFLLNAKNVNTTGGAEGGAVTAAISAVSSQAGILSFLVAIMLLIFSLKTATEFGVAGGSWAAKTVNQSPRAALRGVVAAGRLGGKTAGWVAGGAANKVAERLGAEKGTTFGEKAAKWAGGSRIPLVNTWGARRQGRYEQAREQREKDQTSWVGSVKDLPTLARIANSSPRTKAGKAQKLAAQKRAPSTIANQADFESYLKNAEPTDIAGLPASQLLDIAKRLDASGKKLHHVAPNAAISLLRSASLQKLRGLGYADDAGNKWKYDRNTDTFISPGVATPPDVTAIPTRNPADPKFNPNRYFSDIDLQKYQATREAIQKQGGNPEEFFRGAQYKLRPEQYLGREEFLETFALQQERQRKTERGETRLAELTGIGTAMRKGAKGESVNLAMDFAEGAAMGLALGNAAGANLTGTQKQQAAAALAEKYKAQGEEKEVERRRGELQATADREYETQRAEAARRGELGAATRREVTSAEAAAAVKGDAAFQAKLQQETGQFQAALTNAESINLINKGRTGRSARQALRHESAHDKVEMLSDAERQEMWDQLAPERQQEAEQYIRQNWAGGQQMSPQQIQKEFFTEAFASYGRGKQLGPLTLAPDAEQWDETRKQIEDLYKGDAAAFYNSDTYKVDPSRFLTLGNYERRAKQIPAEQGVIGQLDATLAKNQLDRSQSEVDRLPDDGLRELYKTLPQERKQAIAEYVRSTREDGKHYSDDDVMREFFSQALAAHRGGAADGPLAFTNDEQDMALLLHASARGKVPQFVPRADRAAASTAVSIGELSTRPPTPPIAAAPSGSNRVSVSPPMRILERRFEAPVSPVVQTNVIQNTTIQSVAKDFGQKIEGKLGALPSRQDLLYFLQNLQGNIIQVAKQQGITDREISGLTTEIEQLKADVRSPSQLPKDQEALRTNLTSFMKRFQRFENGAEGESGEDTVAPAA